MEPTNQEKRAGAKAWTGAKPQIEYMRRLAVVFAIKLRITIVTELYQREMSPKQFFEQFGGGSISRVDSNFKVLAEHGWLRHVRSEGPGGSRRGRPEHFYRTTELAIYDNETWALVPYSMRVAISWKAFKTLADRVRQALQAETLDARAEGQHTLTTISLDQLGWERVIAATDAFFESLFEEQEDAKLRIWHTGEKPMVAIVALLTFESPPRPFSSAIEERDRPSLVRTHKEPSAPLPHRVSKVIGDELSLRILSEANLREISAPLIHAEFGGDSIGSIRHRIKALEKVGWLSEVNLKTGGRRRSAKERFYRATAPAIFDDESWASVPASTKPTFSWAIFKLLTDLVKEAIQAETFEARLDKHQSWSLLRLDQQGWEKVAVGVDALLALILEEAGRAEDRLSRSDETPITTTIGLAAFESPKAPKEH